MSAPPQAREASEAVLGLRRGHEVAWPKDHPERQALERDTGRAMSQENVEIVRRMLEASDRRDGAAVFAFYDPEIEWEIPEQAPWEHVHGVDALGGRGVFRGHDAVRRWLREWVGAWEVTDYEHEQLIDAGDQVVHFLRQHVRGRASEIEFEVPPYAQVWTLRDGKIVRMKLYWNRQEALEAAGLRE